MPGAGLTRPEATAHQLRLFLATAEELHFGRAARRLHISQSALSRQIRLLEDRLDLRLFRRSSHAVGLTPAGKELVGDARRVVDALEAFGDSARRWARTPSGRLVVGAVGGETAMPYVRGIAEQLRAEHPRLELEMRTLNFTDQFAHLLQGHVDAVFYRPPVPEGIALLELATEPRVVCVPADSPLARKQAVTMDDLAGWPVVAMPPSVPSVWWDFWAVDPRPDGSRVTYGPVVTDVEALFLAIAGSGAICFLPEAARRLFPRPGVSYLDVIDLTPCISALGWRAGEHRDPVVSALLSVAERVVRASAR
ncbi:MAG TPA: LysR substrate-binding domain-containing protein [Streptomyces sp.]|uniref:LysR family transcriptional regulator n=1 Tax=Streptomyces sp. TaxID=1931 RepID=UPI002C527DFD|nr:LysR substrate-binding domain-containing protein [Streptomyces sp.]HWU11853.1 LysR substrate-binding domain-containing protein [Streptomyces sp.]